MSLDYSFKNGKRENFVNAEGNIKGDAKCVIFASMLVDLGEVSDKNLNEWMFRIEVCRLLDKPFGTKFGDEKPTVAGCIEDMQAAADKGDHATVKAILFGDVLRDAQQAEPRMVDWYPTREEMKQFIGLRTNVSTATRSAFMKKISGHLQREAEAAVRYAQRESDRGKESCLPGTDCPACDAEVARG